MLVLAVAEEVPLDRVDEGVVLHTNHNMHPSLSHITRITQRSFNQCRGWHVHANYGVHWRSAIPAAATMVPLLLTTTVT